MPMMQTLILGEYQNNCYILYHADSKTCVLIDPATNADYILEKVASLGLSVEAILLTHGHFDHVLAVREIAEKTGCPTWMHPGDHSPDNSPMASFFYPLSVVELDNIHYCDEGDILRLAGLEIRILATPGHSKGSVCYLCEDALFTGDTLFAGSIGRTDLPGGSYQTIQTSLERLVALEENYHVFPGHGERSELNAEKRSNPYLR